MFSYADVIGILIIPICTICFLLACTYELVGDLNRYKKICEEYKDKEFNYLNQKAKIERAKLHINSLINNLQEIKEDIDNGEL